VGKGNSSDIGAELVPLDQQTVADMLPIGTGEGVVEALFDWVKEADPDTGKLTVVKRQVRHNAFVYVDEGDMLAAVGGRAGATIMSTLRTIWSGKLIGNTNASAERKRIVPAGQYIYGVVVGVQNLKAGPILDEVDAGTPQRFAWASAIDPSIPEVAPAWPGPLSWQPPTTAQLRDIEDRTGPYLRHTLKVAPAVIDEIQSNDLARARGEITVEPYQAHSDLLRLKIAGLLALLNGQVYVTANDWHLAGMVKAASDRTLLAVQRTVAADATRREVATSARLARRQVKSTAAIEGWRTRECAIRIQTMVNATPGITSTELRRTLRRWRDVLDDGIEHAVSEGWIDERREPGQGSDRRAFYPRRGGGQGVDVHPLPLSKSGHQTPTDTN
jgi:hypothetical protein